MTSLQKLSTVTASTKRQGDVVGGLSGDLETEIVSMKCTPLDPVTPEVAQAVGLDVWVEILQTMVDEGTLGGKTILEGDVFIVDSTEYRVKAVGQWSWRPSSTDTLSVLLEENK